MRHSDLVRRINMGIVLQGSLIVEHGPDADIVTRTALIAQYTGIFNVSDSVKIGVKPFTSIDTEKGLLSVDYAISVLRYVNNSYRSISISIMTPDELIAMGNIRKTINTMMELNTIILDSFAEHNFNLYTAGA